MSDMSEFNWENKKVLVTGSEGFIGSHLVQSLIDKNAKLTCIVKNNFRKDIGFLNELRSDDFKKIKIKFTDITDSESVREAVKENEYVFHLAAEISIPYSYESPRTFVNTNIVGTLNLLLACRDFKVKKFINMSSSEVYGTALTEFIDESHPLQAQSPYSATKIAAEKLTESFHLSYDLPSVNVRAFNTFGPRQSARAVIPTIITQALYRDKILIGDTRPSRDFNFVTDTVSGLLSIAESDRTIGEVINIGSGKDIKISHLLKKIMELTNSKAELFIDKNRMRPEKSEVMKLCAGNSRIRALTNWKPNTSLSDGLSKTINWIKKNPKHFRIGVHEI